MSLLVCQTYCIPYVTCCANQIVPAGSSWFVIVNTTSVATYYTSPCQYFHICVPSWWCAAASWELLYTHQVFPPRLGILRPAQVTKLAASKLSTTATSFVPQRYLRHPYSCDHLDGYIKDLVRNFESASSYTDFIKDIWGRWDIFHTYATLLLIC